MATATRIILSLKQPRRSRSPLSLWVTASRFILGSTYPFAGANFSKVNGLANPLRTAREPLLARCDNASNRQRAVTSRSACQGAVWSRLRSPRHGDTVMTKDQKIIRAKAGLLELAKQLGNVSQACKIMGCSRDSFYRFKDLYDKGGELVLRIVAPQADLEEPGCPGDRAGRQWRWRSTNPPQAEPSISGRRPSDSVKTYSAERRAVGGHIDRDQPPCRVLWRAAPSFMSSSSRVRLIADSCARRAHSHLS